MTVLWLGDEDCHEIQRVGGKSANLSRLAAGYRVPAGFCITPDLYLQRLNEGGQNPAASLELPQNLREVVAREYQEMVSRCGVADPAVAVRSSALDEDDEGTSFAGQYDTYLNITGSEAVVKCWGSVGGERMESYRKEHGLPADSSGVAVLVQQMVAADVSGVVFSANPISGNRDEVMINATWGLGESLVSGKVTPDIWIVDKADSRVKETYIGEKGTMTILEDGGTA